MRAGGLGELIEGFLVADGFTVERPAAHCFAAVRTEPGAPPQRRFVWREAHAENARLLVRTLDASGA